MYQYPIVSRLVHPYAPLIIILGLVIARFWWKGRLSRMQRLSITFPYLLLLVMSLPAVSFLAFAALERPYPPLECRPKQVEAIVILGGYVSTPAGDQGYCVLGADTLSRCLHGAQLFHQGEPCWVIVSGGRVDQNQAGHTVAAAMRDFLISKGVPSDYILLEDRSANTYENAVASSKLLKDRGIEQVVLVTDAASLLRAEKCFQRQGVEVIPSGCRYRTLDGFPFSLDGICTEYRSCGGSVGSLARGTGPGMVLVAGSDLRPAVAKTARSGDLRRAGVTSPSRGRPARAVRGLLTPHRE